MIGRIYIDASHPPTGGRVLELALLLSVWRALSSGATWSNPVDASPDRGWWLHAGTARRSQGARLS